MEFLSERGLNVLNQGSESTFYTHRGGKLYASIVDLAFCSDAMLHRVSGWEVIQDDARLSDHRKICFRLSTTSLVSDKIQRTTRCFNTKKANWSTFAESFAR